MTPKQVERVKKKIINLKAALAADKKYWGGEYHDGRGLRYIPPQLYISIEDFSGGLRYFNWFHKNFSDDICYPDFLFEWTIVLFKTNKVKDAERKAFELFCSDKDLFIKIVGNNDSTNLDKDFEESYINELKNKESLSDFKTWLDKLNSTEKFMKICNKYVDIKNRLLTEKDLETEEYLEKQLVQLSNEL